MMIKIANRFRPYSKNLRCKARIPASCFDVEVFPSYLKVYRDEKVALEISFKMHAPFQSITTMQDIEKKRLLIFGEASEGYFRYSLAHHEDALSLKLERSSFMILYKIESIEDLSFSGSLHALLNKEKDLVFKTKEKEIKAPHIERISFGNHKAQDMTLIRRRLDPKEFLPIWFFLGQFAKKDEVKEEVFPLSSFKESFKSHYFDLFSKSDLSPKHLGHKEEQDPISLYGGYVQIRRLLLHSQKGIHSILTDLPHTLDAGRAKGLKIEEGVYMDLEWSKKKIKKVIIHSNKKTSLTLRFKRENKTLRQTYPSKMQRMRSLQDGDLIIDLQEGITTVDRFRF